jgi:hypothetical protein
MVLALASAMRTQAMPLMVQTSTHPCVWAVRLTIACDKTGNKAWSRTTSNATHALMRWNAGREWRSETVMVMKFNSRLQQGQV